MLVHLHVKNLALIEEAEVDFGPGLNILTGETGAGKSILLGSMQLVLGAKMSRERFGRMLPMPLWSFCFTRKILRCFPFWRRWIFLWKRERFCCPERFWMAGV